jgi:small conductance mechanosensitive channel
LEEITQAFSAALGFSVAGITFGKFLSALALLAVCLLVVKILLKVTDKILRRAGVDRSLHAFLRTAIKVLLLFLTVLMVAPVLNIPVTSLVAVLSVVGLAISLAIQNSLSNVAGGIQLLTSKPFKIGDYVEAGGSAGTVVYVGVFYTKIHSTDNKLIQIPNSQITADKIINYTAEPERRVDLTFTVSYDAPVETVKGAIAQVMGSHPLTLTTPEPFVRVSKYGDSSIEYTLRVWCATGDYWTVYFDLLEQVKAVFDREGIEMTYPHLNVHMVEKQ